MNRHAKLIQAAHTVDLIIRKDGHEYRLQGDWIKALIDTWLEMFTLIESLNNWFGVLGNRTTLPEQLTFMAHSQTLRSRVGRVLKVTQDKINITEIWQ